MLTPPSPSEELPKRLEKATINELPLVHFHGSIQVAEDSESFEQLCTLLVKRKSPWIRHRVQAQFQERSQQPARTDSVGNSRSSLSFYTPPSYEETGPVGKDSRRPFHH